jgi:hypothetical protein
MRLNFIALCSLVQVNTLQQEVKTHRRNSRILQEQLHVTAAAGQGHGHGQGQEQGQGHGQGQGQEQEGQGQRTGQGRGYWRGMSPKGADTASLSSSGSGITFTSGVEEQLRKSLEIANAKSRAAVGAAAKARAEVAAVRAEAKRLREEKAAQEQDRQ